MFQLYLWFSWVEDIILFGLYWKGFENQIMGMNTLRTVWERESLSWDINGLDNERKILIRLSIPWSPIIIWFIKKK